MKKRWRLDQKILIAHGVKALECLADTKEEAFENFKSGNCMVVDKLIDVVEAKEMQLSDIRKIES
jgi:hypothetical protein